MLDKHQLSHPESSHPHFLLNSEAANGLQVVLGKPSTALDPRRQASLGEGMDSGVRALQGPCDDLCLPSPGC